MPGWVLGRGTRPRLSSAQSQGGAAASELDVLAEDNHLSLFCSEQQVFCGLGRLVSVLGDLHLVISLCASVFLVCKVCVVIGLSVWPAEGCQARPLVCRRYFRPTTCLE